MVCFIGLRDLIYVIIDQQLIAQIVEHCNTVFSVSGTGALAYRHHVSSDSSICFGRDGVFKYPVRGQTRREVSVVMLWRGQEDLYARLLSSIPEIPGSRLVVTPRRGSAPAVSARRGSEGHHSRRECTGLFRGLFNCACTAPRQLPPPSPTSRSRWYVKVCRYGSHLLIYQLHV